MEIIGYILAIFIGLSLGLVGSGGSILTVPLLVYFFHIEPTIATSYSLFIVGAASGVGTAIRIRQRQVNFRILALFGTSSILTVFLTRKFVFPTIPDILFQTGQYQISKSFALMILFAILILLSSLYVLKGQPENKEQLSSPSKLTLLLCGVGIGLITGFLGAGGGFLIVPVLMMLYGLSIKTAAGTSLAIITANTLLGGIGDLGHVPLDWTFLITLIMITLIGLFAGNALSQRIHRKKLSQGFGWFLLVMAVLILVLEITAFNPI